MYTKMSRIVSISFSKYLKGKSLKYFPKMTNKSGAVHITRYYYVENTTCNYKQDVTCNIYNNRNCSQ